MAAGLIATLAVFLTSCGLGSSSIEGSGTVQTERYDDVAEFSVVHISDDLNVDLTVEPEGPPLIEVSIDDNLHQYLSVDVDGGRLQIGTSSDIAPTSDLVVRVSGYTITALEATGNADIEATMPTVALLELQIDDDATMTLVVDTDRLVVSGDSDAVVRVTGRADHAEIGVANNSEALLAGTGILTATVNASSDAIVELEASDEVQGSADNDAVVRVGGTATVMIDTSSDAQVISLN